MEVGFTHQPPKKTFFYKCETIEFFFGHVLFQNWDCFLPLGVNTLISLHPRDPQWVHNSFHTIIVV
jgi:hypothetical protein